MERVPLAGRKNAWVAGREPCRTRWGAVRNEAGRAPKISHLKTTTLMSRKTSHRTAAGKAKVARATTNTTIQDTPIYHVGLDVHAADFTTAIAGPGRDGDVREPGTFTCDLHTLEDAIERGRLWRY